MYRQAPPNLHMSTLNPHINIDNFPVVFPKECTPLGTWKEDGSHLFAGLSSRFGFGGTIFSVIWEQYHHGDSEKSMKTFMENQYSSPDVNLIASTTPVVVEKEDRPPGS